MEKTTNLAVVVTRYCPTALSIVRSLGAAGFKVDLVASVPEEGGSLLVAKSKYVNETSELVVPNVKKGGSSELLAALKRYEGRYSEKPVLFPTDDYVASVVDRNRDILSEIFAIPGIDNKAGALVKVMNKDIQNQTALAAGIKTPRESVIHLSASIDIPDDVIYPCFCKPLESYSGNKGEIGVCKDRQALMEYLQWLNSRITDRDVLVQEYLNIDREIVLAGVCLDQEVIVPAIINKTHVARFERGVTLAGRIAAFEELGGLQSPIIEMMQSYHYTGMFDLELNVVGNDIYFGEINFRSGGPNYSYFKSGANLPALLVSELMGIKHDKSYETVDQYGLSFVNEKVAWKDYAAGYISHSELDTILKSADFGLINDDSDPEPGAVFNSEIHEYVRKEQGRKTKNKIKTAIKPIAVTFKSIARGYPQTKAKNRRTASNIDKRVIITGRNYCNNLCMARSLGEAGYEVEVVRIFNKKADRLDTNLSIRPEAYSKYVKAYYECTMSGNSRRLIDQLLKLSDSTSKLVIIPTDDVAAYVLDEYYSLLSERFCIQNVGNKQGNLIELMSKGVQTSLAKAAGLPVLNSCVIKTVSGAIVIPDSVSYPCFIKPDVSRLTSKKRMKKCDNEEDLRTALEEIAQTINTGMLVEDYVEISREISLLGLSFNGKSICPGAFEAVSGGSDARKGVAIVGKIINPEELGQILEDIRKFTESLNYEGLFDVDLVESVDGQIYFVEINMRYGASGYALTSSGLNLPGQYVACVKDGIEPHVPTDIKYGSSFASEKILADELADGKLEADDVRRIMSDVDILFIKNSEDMKPYRCFNKFKKID